MLIAFLIFCLIALSKLHIPFALWITHQCFAVIGNLFKLMDSNDQQDLDDFTNSFRKLKTPMLWAGAVVVLTPSISEWAAIITLGSIASVDGISNIPVELVDLSTEYLKGLKAEVIAEAAEVTNGGNK